VVNALEEVAVEHAGGRWFASARDALVKPFEEVDAGCESCKNRKKFILFWYCVNDVHSPTL